MTVNNGIVRLNKQFNIISIDSEIELLLNQFFLPRKSSTPQNTGNLIGKKWTDVVIGLQGSEQAKPWLLAYQSHSDQTSSLSFRTKDRVRLELTLRYSPVFDDNNNLIEMLIFIIIPEVTQQMKKELEIEKAFYRAIVEDMPSLIYRYTTDGIVTLANTEVCTYLGSKAEDIVGMSIYDVIDPENVEKAKLHLASITPENPISSHEHSAQIERETRDGISGQTALYSLQMESHLVIKELG